MSMQEMSNPWNDSKPPDPHGFFPRSTDVVSAAQEAKANGRGKKAPAEGAPKMGAADPMD